MGKLGPGAFANSAQDVSGVRLAVAALPAHYPFMRAAGLGRLVALAIVVVVAAAHCGGDISESAQPSGNASTDSSADEGPASFDHAVVEDALDATSFDDASSDVDAATPDAPTQCQPGQTESCYEGPLGTNGVGVCGSGTRLCADDGAYGACVGQLLPSEETCTSPFDDDCDGAANEGGKDCACTQGTEIDCYTGPSQTLGVGSCKSGTQTCLSTGLGYGACADEVLPGVENCATAADEDCDGEPECAGDVHWAYAYDWPNLIYAARGGGSKLGLLTYYPWEWAEVDSVGSLTVIQSAVSNAYTPYGPGLLGGDPTGASELVVGTYDKSSPWAPLLPSEIHGLFVMLRNGWQRGFATQGNVSATSAVMHPTGSPPAWYIGGKLSGSLETTPGVVISSTATYEPLFLMKIGAANGNASFGRAIFEPAPGTTSFTAELSGLQAVAQGVAVVGTFSSSVSLDGKQLTSKGDDNVFVAVMDGTGNTTGAFSFGAGSLENVTVVGRAGIGPVVVAGAAWDGMTIGTVDFAPGTYLLRFSDALKPVSALQFSGCTYVYAAALDELTEDAYHVLYCGTYKDFGGGQLPPGVVLLGLDKNNQHRFSRSLPSSAKVQHMLAFDGALYLAGTFQGSADFGAGAIQTKYPTNTELFVVRMTK